MMMMMASEEIFFYIFFRKYSLSVAMETNQIQQFGQNSYAS